MSVAAAVAATAASAVTAAVAGPATAATADVGAVAALPALLPPLLLPILLPMLDAGLENELISVSGNGSVLLHPKHGCTITLFSDGWLFLVVCWYFYFRSLISLVGRLVGWSAGRSVGCVCSSVCSLVVGFLFLLIQPLATSCKQPIILHFLGLSCVQSFFHPTEV